VNNLLIHRLIDSITCCLFCSDTRFSERLVLTTIAIYPGSFDPITLGHVDVITRASKMFDRVIMAVVANPQKHFLFAIPKRVTLIEESVRLLANVTVESFEGLTVDFARKHNASVIIRGLRAISDFEYEFRMSQMNKTLYPELETIFIMAKLDYTFLSSSTVKEVVQLGGNVHSLVPKPVQQALSEIYPAVKS
jgi:pantetheine-phosphate adenylyltransferase